MNPAPHFRSQDSDPSRRETALQAPRLRDRLRKVLLDQGHPLGRVERYVEWCKDFVVYTAAAASGGNGRDSSGAIRAARA